MTRPINANAPMAGGEAIKAESLASDYTSNNNLSHDLCLEHAGTEPRIDSRLIARHLGLQHRSIYALLDRHKSDFKELGLLRFQIASVKQPGARGVKHQRFAFLNEDQCYLLLTYSRNTAKVRALKLRLVQAFREARQAQDIHRTEYLPAYHSLHDEIARLANGSANQRFMHINFNKAINKAVGIQSGDRHTIPLPSKSLLIVAQHTALRAVSGAVDHKHAYKSAKLALGDLSQAVGVMHAQ